MKHLSNSDLLFRTKAAVAEERTRTAIVIEHLEEVSRRRLDAELGYSSLFAFCQKELGYTEDQAQARISAMRLVAELPELKPAISDGRLSLTHLSKAQTFFRQEKKAGKAYSKEEKCELVREMEGLSKRQCEKKLAELSPESVQVESVRPISDTALRLTVTLSHEALEDLGRLKELWGNQDLSYSELIAKLAKAAREKAERRVKPAPAPAYAAASAPAPAEAPAHSSASELASTPAQTPPPAFVPGHAPVAAPAPAHAPASAPVPAQVSRPLGHSRYIPARTRKEVWARDQGRCQYQDPVTGKRCHATYALQLDHCQPFAQGGSNTAVNLRLLCRAHNALLALQTYGATKMTKYTQSRT